MRSAYSRTDYSKIKVVVEIMTLENANEVIIQQCLKCSNAYFKEFGAYLLRLINR